VPPRPDPAEASATASTGVAWLVSPEVPASGCCCSLGCCLCCPKRASSSSSSSRAVDYTSRCLRLRRTATTAAIPRALSRASSAARRGRQRRRTSESKSNCSASVRASAEVLACIARIVLSGRGLAGEAPPAGGWGCGESPDSFAELRAAPFTAVDSAASAWARSAPGLVDAM